MKMICMECNKEFVREKDWRKSEGQNIFCSHSCSASFSNKRRSGPYNGRTKEEREKVRKIRQEEKIGYKEISKRTGIPRSTIRNWCRDIKIDPAIAYRKSIKKSKAQKEIECSQCGRIYKYDRSRGHTKTKCNSCMANKRRAKVRKKATDYLGGKCIRCGYDKCKEALCFHHLDPDEKNFIISGNCTRKWEVIVAELDKCILLCHNCHSELHAGLWTSGSIG